MTNNLTLGEATDTVTSSQKDIINLQSAMSEDRRKVRAYLRNPRQRLIEQERQSSLVRPNIAGASENHQPISLNAQLIKLNRPPLGTSKQTYNSSYAEGYEGVIDGMIQGTFRSIDNEIDQ